MNDRKESQIRQIGLFTACRPEHVRWIGRAADAVDVQEGAILAKAGSRAMQFVVIVSGAVVMCDGSSETVLGPGSYFGALEIVDDRTYSYEISAKTSVRLLAFDVRSFRGLLTEVPPVARRILGDIAARVPAGTVDLATVAS